MPPRLGLGLVGAGRMGTVHARIVARSVPEVRLVAIADVNVEAARRLAAELDVPSVYDHHATLAAARDVHAVLIAAPTNQHLTIVRDVAAAGKDMLCEKPLALTLGETDAAIAAAGRAGVRLQVGFMRRWDPEYARAKARIASGAIGRPVVFKSLQFDTEFPSLAFCDPAVSGGILVDMGIHEFDLGRWLLDDEVVEVHAFADALVYEELAKLGDADNAVVNLRFASGALGSVELSRTIAYGEDVRSEVAGSRGSVFIGFLPVTAGAIGTTSQVSIDMAPMTTPRFCVALAEQVRGFVRAVVDECAVAVGGAESRAALAIALAADASRREGRPIALAALAA